MRYIIMTFIAMLIYGIVVYFINRKKSDKSKKILINTIIKEALIFGVIYYIFNIIIDKFWP